MSKVRLKKHKTPGCLPETKPVPWSTGTISTAAGPVVKVSIKLSFQDMLGSVKARLGIGRDHYSIEPGLYCVGVPNDSSPVLVTANYKMTFDSLRMELSGLNAWILVLDTKGINVWCAAGKGTFGTKELVNRIKSVQLSSIVTHRNIVLPQLGAPGISAHTVFKLSGFKVVYGPVRACDIKAFMDHGMEADKEMRTVRFTMIDRLVLAPLELISTFKPLLLIFGVLFILNTLGLGSFNFIDLYGLIGAVLVGAVLVPLLLPFIPGRAFSFKGWLLGLLWVLGVLLLNGFPGIPSFGMLHSFIYLLILPPLSSYLAMNFTGCSTYTSFSGVKREMKIALPLMILSLSAGVLILIVQMVIVFFS